MKKIKAEKQIRIPIELTKNLDKITLAELQTIEALHFKEKAPREISSQMERHTSSEHFTRKFTQISLQSRKTQRLSQVQQNERVTLTRQKSSSVRFRTTGAGFRQRVNKKIEEPQKTMVPLFKRTANKPTRMSLPIEPSQQYQRFKQFIVQKQQYLRREQPILQKRQLPPRMYFGQNYAFKEQGEYQYNERFNEEDMDWGDELNSYGRIGFGVSNNLAAFDLSSLADPQGDLFLSQHKNQIGFCPIYQHSKYSWMEVKVIGFDALSKKVIVHRPKSDDIKKISRLSIKFGENANSEAQYWQRVNTAKKYQKNVKQFQKFVRYINSRKEVYQFDDGPFDNPVWKLNKKWKNAVYQQWLTFYSRMFNIMKEMDLKPQKFSDMGIKIRRYVPFRQPPIADPYVSFQNSKKILAKRHYSRIEAFPRTLNKLFERLTQASCSALSFSNKLSSLQSLTDRECGLVSKTISNIKTTIRQFLISDIMGPLAFAFKSKAQQKYNYKLHNFIFKDLLLSHLYIENIRKWIHYLRSFTEWTRDTPAPIVVLTLTVDQQRKEVDVRPNYQQIKDMLKQPIRLLEHEMQKIPDLLSEVLGGEPSNIKISHSLLSEVEKEIARSTDYSMAPVNTFVQNYQNKLKYLQKMKWNKESFSNAGKERYRQILQTIKKELKEVTHSLIFRTGFLEVDSKPLKKIISDGIVRENNRLGRFIQKQIQEEIQRMAQQFQNRNQYFKQVPQDELQLVTMRTYLNNDCHSFLDHAIAHYQLCQDFFELLQDFFIAYAPTTFQKNMKMVRIHFHFLEAINSKLSQLLLIQQTMIERINEERELIIKGMQEMTEKIQIIKLFSTLKEYSQNYVFTNRNYLQVQGYQNQLSNINDRQRVLSQQISIFPGLLKLEKELRPYYDLWNIGYDLTNKIFSIKSDPIQTLQYQQLKQKMTQYHRQLQNLLNFFTKSKNISAIGIIQSLNEKIEYAQDKLWIIRSFTLQGMIKKEGIRNEVLNDVFNGKQVKFAQITMEDLLKQNLKQKKEFIVSNAEKAQRIWKLELRIAEIVSNVKTLQFVFSQRQGLPIIDEELLLSLACSVHEQLQLMDTIKDLQQAQYINKKVNNVHNKLKTIQDTMLLMAKFQEEFFPLKVILDIQDISGSMEKEIGLFKDVQKLWKGTLNHFMKDSQVWEAIDTDSYKNRLQNAFKSLALVEKRLNEVVDQKRMEFPKLFFLERKDIRHLLINPEKISSSRYMSALFTGIKSLTLTSDEKIKGIKSYNSQQIHFKKPIHKKVLWYDLKAISQELSKVISEELNLLSNKNQMYLFGKTARLHCELTYQIQQAFAKKKELEGVKSNIILQLEKMGEKPSFEHFVLSSFLLYFRDRISDLVCKNVKETSHFQWKKQLKFYRSQSQGIQLKFFTFSFPFESQYTGAQIRPFVLLSDRGIVHMSVLSWHYNTGIYLQGKGLESIKQLCALTMRHFVQLPIGEQTSPGKLNCYFKGYLCSEAWVCFEVETSLKRELFQMLAQISFEIHSIISAKNTLFYIGGEHYNLHKRFRFNLILNKQYQEPKYLEKSGFQTKNMNFTLLFRAFDIPVVPCQQIFKFYLTSIALPQQFIDSILKCYQIYKLQQLDQWYHSRYLSVLKEFSTAYLLKVEQIELTSLFSKIWLKQFKSEHLKQIHQLLPLPQQSQSQILQDVITAIDRGQHLKNQILLIGPPLSGKRHLTNKLFSQLQLDFLEPLQYKQEHETTWITMQQKFYTREIPLEQKLVLRAKQTNFLQPSIIDGFIIIYHHSNISWKDVVQNNLNRCGLEKQIKREIQRQLSILFDLDSLKRRNISNISLCLSLIRMIEMFTTRGKFQNLNIIQRTQIIFMFLLWQVAAIYPEIVLVPSDFGASVVREPFSYYYDLNKSAWLEWVTQQEFHRDNSSISFVSQLFVPIKESISLIYFLSCTREGNVWVQSQTPGIGLHRLLQTIVSTGILQMYRTHKNITYSGLSKVINYDIAIFKKSGKYYPRLNSHLTICIEDINLSLNPDFQDQLSILINYSFDNYLKRSITKTNFVCTNHDKMIGGKMSVNLAKSIVHVRAKNVSEESKKSIFGYYLQWFFGNTDNPFSKQVRMATELMVNLSLYFMQETNKNRNNAVSLSHLVQLYEGLCMSSPKTVKSTSDILELWHHQLTHVFHHQRFGKDNFENVVLKFFRENQGVYDSKVIEIMRKTVRENVMFIRLKHNEIEDSQTYRKIDKKLVFDYFLTKIKEIDYKLFSHLPLITYTDLLNFIFRVIRIFTIPKRHVLLYGGRSSCQKIVFRLASFLHYGRDTECVSFIKNWQGRVISAIRPLMSEKQQKCLIFSTEEQQSDLFLQIIQEVITLHHPRTFLLDAKLKYLQKLGLSSASSNQYSLLKHHIEYEFTCCIGCPLSEVVPLEERYPAMMRRVQALNILENYYSGGLSQIAASSIGTFSSHSKNILKMDTLLTKANLPLPKSKWFKILQQIAYFYNKSQLKIKAQQDLLDACIKKILKIQQQKRQLQEQLKMFYMKLQKIKIKVGVLWQDYKKNEEIYQGMVNNCNQYNQECQIQRNRTDDIRKDVEMEFGKVQPMLTAAQEAMAKVTRDDINQLRSFPNPPLPAAKVVESLVFLFNEQSQVKEKVLQSGEKVRDFWEYAKKMILNDQLLKRVKEFSPETIKNLEGVVVATLKNIIKKPQFSEDRVFKASSAAGNLSLWIKAIVAVYDVMKIIEPKRLLLSEAQEILANKEAHLKMLLDQINVFHQKLMEKKKSHNSQVQEREKVEIKIKQLEQYLSAAAELLSILHARQQEWQHVKSTDLVRIKKQSQELSVIVAINIELLIPLPLALRQQLVATFAQNLGIKMNTEQHFYNSIFLNEYKPLFLSMLTPSEQFSPFSIPLIPNFTHGLVTFHELLPSSPKQLCIYDQTQLFQDYLKTKEIVNLLDSTIQFLDCAVKIPDLDQFLKKEERVNYEDDQDEQLGVKDKKKIVVIKGLEDHYLLMERIGELLDKYAEYLILIVVRTITDQFRVTMARRRWHLNIRFQKSRDIWVYFIKKAFNLQIFDLVELTHSVEHQNTKQSMLSLLLAEEHIITNEEVLEEWLSLHRLETRMAAERPAVKKLTKIQEETINQIVEILMHQYCRTSVPLFLNVLGYFFNQEEEHPIEPTLWNFPQYLALKLKQHFDTIVQVSIPETAPLSLCQLQQSEWWSLNRVQKEPECEQQHE